MTSHASPQPSARVTQARAAAQRTKLDAQARRRRTAVEEALPHTRGKSTQASLLSKRRASATMEGAIADYLLDHEGGNASQKTIQWHQTALGLLRSFLEEERGIRLVGEVDAPDINAWFAFMRKTPASRGKIRSERTIQTYARSARAFFHWLVRRETIERSPFDRVVFPKVGKPLIRILESDEFERLLVACTPPGEIGPLADRAA
ncbi:MAG: site-specific integrase, partial [Ktedonobacteraceae bacterium]|nr:site-specific integrase [Ktedonobacteraceae bacterium]